MYKEYKPSFVLLGCNDTYEEIHDSQVKRFPDWLFMIVQHGIGFLICAPAIFGWVDPVTARSLVCFSGVCEIAWEWEDYTERMFRRCTYKFGAKTEPTPILILFGVHHLLGLFVLPMNLYYYDEYYYWTLVAWNQAGACIAYTIT